MKKRDNDRRYMGLLKKDYIDTLVSDISTRFDFNTNSWISESIVTFFNETIEQWEKNENIIRLKPGDILLPYKDNNVTISLFDKEFITMLVETKLFPPYKKRILNKTLAHLKDVDKDANLENVYNLISHRDLVPVSKPGINLNDISSTNPPYPLVNPHDIVKTVPKFNYENLILPIDIKNKLIDFCIENIGLKHFFAENLVNYFILRRTLFLPLKSSLKPGQMVWIGSCFKKTKKVGCVKIEALRKPIILTLYTENEMKQKCTDLKELDKRMMKQLARITTEAYLQETLLPQDELQLFYLRSTELGLC